MSMYCINIIYSRNPVWVIMYYLPVGLGWPNGLTVDYEANHLYWADAREDYIAMCDFNGNNHRKLADRLAAENSCICNSGVFF